MVWPEVHRKLVQALRKRESRKMAGFGLTTADNYVRGMVQCVGVDACEKFYAGQDGKPADISALVKRSENVLTYSGEEMAMSRFENSGAKFAEVLSEIQADEAPKLPEKTLAAFTHILTTPSVDRDGDSLKTEGAEVDPKLPGLWQHVHTLPIGGMLGIVEHTPEVLKIASVLLDLPGNGGLTQDAAILLQAGFLRFSHGFQALEWRDRKGEAGEVGPVGFDILRFKILEWSGVSVPSNVDAEPLDVFFSVEKQLRSDWARSFGKAAFEGRGRKSFRGAAGSPDGGREAQAGCGCGGAGEPTKAAEAVKLAGRRKSWELEGSFEWTRSRLTQGLPEHLAANGQGFDKETDWAWIHSTFENSAVVGWDSWEHDGPPKFWEAEWSKAASGPKWTGGLSAVEIVVRTELVREERAAGAFVALAKASSGDEREFWLRKACDVFEKVGARISASTRSVLVEVRDDVKELKAMDLPRGGSAMCERCIKALDGLIVNSDDGGDDDEKTGGAPEPMTAEAAAAFLISEGSPEVIKRVAEFYRVTQQISREAQEAQEFAEFFGSV